MQSHNIFDQWWPGFWHSLCCLKNILRSFPFWPLRSRSFFSPLPWTMPGAPNFSCEFVFFRQSFGLKENGALRLRWVLKTWLMCLGLKCMNFNGTKKQRKHTDLTGWEVLMTPSIRFQGGLKPAMVFVFEIQANNVLGFYPYTYSWIIASKHHVFLFCKLRNFRISEV